MDHTLRAGDTGQLPPHMLQSKGSGQNLAPGHLRTKSAVATPRNPRKPVGRSRNVVPAKRKVAHAQAKPMIDQRRQEDKELLDVAIEENALPTRTDFPDWPARAWKLPKDFLHLITNGQAQIQWTASQSANLVHVTLTCSFGQGKVFIIKSHGKTKVSRLRS